MEAQLLLVTILKALTELAGLFLLGQGLLYALAGPKRDSNFFYQLLRVLTAPVLRATRWITPRVVVDRHIPYVAFMILFWLWVALTLAKIQLCAGAENLCQPRQESSALDWRKPRIPV